MGLYIANIILVIIIGLALIAYVIFTVKKASVCLLLQAVIAVTMWWGGLYVTDVQIAQNKEAIARIYARNTPGPVNPPNGPIDWHTNQRGSYDYSLPTPAYEILRHPAD